MASDERIDDLLRKLDDFASKHDGHSDTYGLPVYYGDNPLMEPMRDIVRGWVGTLATYSHRNGETDGPTVAGLYWFKGYNITGYTYRTTMVIQTHTGQMYAYDYGQESYFETDHFKGEWWGPLIPPWEVNQ